MGRCQFGLKSPPHLPSLSTSRELEAFDNLDHQDHHPDQISTSLYCSIVLGALIYHQMDSKGVTGDQLVEKLESLGVNKNSRPASEGSYDYVEEKADSMERPVESAVSVSTAKEWEKQLMKDPKVSG